MRMNGNEAQLLLVTRIAENVNHARLWQSVSSPFNDLKINQIAIVGIAACSS